MGSNPATKIGIFAFAAFPGNDMPQRPRRRTIQSSLRASEPDRSTNPLEHKVTVDDFQGRGSKIDLAEVVWLKAKMERIAEVRIELHRLADDFKNGKDHPDAGWGIVAREGRRKTVLAQLFLLSPPIRLRDHRVEILPGHSVRDVQRDLEDPLCALGARNEDEAGHPYGTAGEHDMVAAHRPFSRRLFVQRAVG